MTNPHPLKRELPNQFGADAIALTEREMWRSAVSNYCGCPKCGAAKGEFCNLKNGQMALRCHPIRSKKFIFHLKSSRCT